MCLRPLHRRQGALADAAGIGVVDQRPVEHRAHVGHQGMVQNPLAETGGMDDPRLGIADAETAHPADLDRPVEDLAAQAASSPSRSARNSAPRRACPCPWRHGGRRARLCQSATRARPTGYASWRSSARGLRERLAQQLQKGSPYFSTRASPMPGISRRAAGSGRDAGPSPRAARW